MLFRSVRLGHRRTAARSQAVVLRLIDEVEQTVGHHDLFERLGEMLDESTEDDGGRKKLDKLNDLYQKVIALPGRIDATKRLVETFEKLVRLEREAFGLDRAEKSPHDLAELSDDELDARIADGIRQFGGGARPGKKPA